MSYIKISAFCTICDPSGIVRVLAVVLKFGPGLQRIDASPMNEIYYWALNSSRMWAANQFLWQYLNNYLLLIDFNHSRFIFWNTQEICNRFYEQLEIQFCSNF